MKKTKPEDNPTKDGEGDDLPPLPSWQGGRELVDVSNREELYRILDEPEVVDPLR